MCAKAIEATINKDSKAIIIGVAPGENEDDNGSFFYYSKDKRRAGTKVKKVIIAVKHDISDYSYTNLVNEYPGKNENTNRDNVPTSIQIANRETDLITEIEKSGAETIIALGNIAGKYLKKMKTNNKLEGKVVFEVPYPTNSNTTFERDFKKILKDL